MSIVADPAGGFNVLGTHTYDPSSTYTAVVTVTGTDGFNSTSGLAHAYLAEGNTADETSQTPATIIGDVDYGTGQVGGAFQFSGDDGDVQLGEPALLTSDFSIDFWMETTSTQAMTILGNRISTGDGNYLSLRLEPGPSSSPILDLELDGDEDATNFVEVTSGQVPVNNSFFHQIAIVRQGATVLLYVDGELQNAAIGAGVVDLNDVNPILRGLGAGGHLGKQPRLVQRLVKPHHDV